MNSQKKVLIVEPDESAARILRDLLKYYGYASSCVASAEEAAKELQSGDYGLVIASYPMPGEGWPGFEAALRSCSPDIPIIRLSKDALGAEHLDCGIEIVGRPLDFQGLMTAIGVALKSPRPHP